MVGTVHVEFGEEKFEELKELKEEKNLTWRDVIIEGARVVEKHEA